MLCVFAFAFTACDKSSAEVLDIAKQVISSIEDDIYMYYHGDGNGVEVLKVEYAKMESYKYMDTDVGDCYLVRIVLEYVMQYYGAIDCRVCYYMWYRDPEGGYRAYPIGVSVYVESVPNAKETGKLSKIQIKELNKYIKEN